MDLQGASPPLSCIAAPHSTDVSTNISSTSSTSTSSNAVSVCVSVCGTPRNEKGLSVKKYAILKTEV